MRFFKESIVYSLFFSLAASASKVVETKTNDIVAMVSPEKERVPLGKVRLAF
jgi:hypothetical protein